MTWKPLYVKLEAHDRAQLDKLAADSGAAIGRPVTVSDVVRQLVRDATKRGKPVRVHPNEGR